MNKYFLFRFLIMFTLFSQLLHSQSKTDWLLDDTPYEATISQQENKITLSNGLISRTLIVQPNAATIAFDNLMTGESIIRGIKPEAEVEIDGVLYPVGGLIGQPNYAFLRKEWIEGMKADTNAFQFRSYRIGKTEKPFDWKQVRHKSKTSGQWPAPGISLELEFSSNKADLRGIVVIVHYEMYDGIPLMGKWISLINGGDRAMVINDFSSEILAIVEFSSSVDTRNTNVPVPNIHAETDYAFGSMVGDDANSKAVHWEADPDYLTQVNYQRNNPCLLRISPETGPEVSVSPKDTFRSFRAFILPFDSYDRERQGLARRRMYRKIAPWTTENPLMMHVRNADWESVKTAIDQAAEAGFEMLILTFGSGFNIEDDDPEYLKKMREYSDYAKAKGLEIGGYSLLASRTIDKDNDIQLPDSLRPIFGHSPCLGSKWAGDYFEKLYNFFEQTGFTLLEHDGSYPGDLCFATNHPGHRSHLDSRWRQYEVISRFYRWCRSQGIYLNIPDYYYLTGGNKCGMGYRETNWSLPRDQQVIHTRQNIYDGTWTKLVTMGWMFVPLTEYHGGGAAATIEPLNEHLDHYELMMRSNLSAGVQACYRGPRLYDTEETKEMVKNSVSWYKQHREVLEGDLIHLRRADGRDLDYWLMVNPAGQEKAALVVFNPTGEDISRTIKVPLYYSGLTHDIQIFSQGKVESRNLERDYSIDLQVSVPAGKWNTYFFE